MGQSTDRQVEKIVEPMLFYTRVTDNDCCEAGYSRAFGVKRVVLSRASHL